METHMCQDGARKWGARKACVKCLETERYDLRNFLFDRLDAHTFNSVADHIKEWEDTRLPILGRKDGGE